LYRFQISHVLSFCFEDLEKDGLPFDLLFSEGISGFLRNKAMPGLICFGEFTLLESAKRFFGIQADSRKKLKRGLQLAQGLIRTTDLKVPEKGHHLPAEQPEDD
jgi:hypothetical protein